MCARVLVRVGTLGLMAALEALASHTNQLAGTLPTELVKLSPLTHLLLGANQLIELLSDLTWLHFGFSLLTGTTVSFTQY
jgi:hypothetical protein